MSEPEIRRLLQEGLDGPRLRLEQAHVRHFATLYGRWPGAREPAPAWAGGLETVYRLNRFLGEQLGAMRQNLDRLRQHHAEYHRRQERATGERERHRAILDFAARLGADRRQLRGDRRALRRWFDHDAVVERYQRRQSDLERRLVFCLGRLEPLQARLLSEIGHQRGHRWIWDRLGIEALLQPLLAHEGDPRVRTAASRCLTAALRSLPEDQREAPLGPATLQYLYRSALDTGQDIWIQCEVLSLMQSLGSDEFLRVLRARIARPGGGDDLFVRRRAVQLLARSLAAAPDLAVLLRTVQRDPSPLVRQTLAESLPELPVQWLPRLLQPLAREDESPQVRAMTLVQFPALLREPALEPSLRATLASVLETENHRFVLRVALRTVWQVQQQLVAQGAEAEVRTWTLGLNPLLDDLHREAPDLAVRRWAAQTRERLWAGGDPQRRTLLAALRERLTSIGPGRHRRLGERALAGVDRETLGRLLAVLALDDFGWDVDRRWRGWRLTRGQVLKFRSWRLWHELRHSSTDKRQAHRHTIGRVYRGDLRAPSAILSELAETKVPGEPLYIPGEDGWRSYLPLVDELISCIDHDRGRLELYTSEGVTEIEAPASLFGKLRARLALTLRFPRYARLRNWQESSQDSPAEYLRQIARLGFRLRLRPHRDAGAGALDPSVQRFFPAVLPVIDPSFWLRIRDYFFSVYQNTLYELGLFLAAIGSLFVGRHLYVNSMVRRARRSIPLVIGGWGTRGKSGTERLKGALINALGHTVVSKTTGCEAMFLHGHGHGPLRELFLFRPYDKATIWEQTNLLRLSRALGCEVFLWECMGLTPSYVHVLQRQWMRDDIATLTNTYPDHEDLQGPAGYNIPEVMINFIPRGSRLFTTEEQMLPILREACAGLGTAVRSVGWLEAGLLTPDVLQRFPYEEHPYNIALVLAMAEEELGVARDFAVKEIADRVVLDLGVLKSYPTARVQTRSLEFVNGMSANERYGCLGNWQRMGFADHDPYAEPGTWLTTVVNNRADRVPRSRVFAGILVADISADRHFLIGTNLTGLQGYIRESWDSHAEGLSLWPEDQRGESPQAILDAQMRRLRLPLDEAHILAELRVMLEGLGAAAEPAQQRAFLEQPARLNEHLNAAGAGAHADAAVAQLKRQTRILGEYRQLAGRIAQAGPDQRAALDTLFREQLWAWFVAKLVVIDDAQATGEQILQRIWQETPPGFRNRIMGIQNIKGPGLDFVYRWQTWDSCAQACAQLDSDNPADLQRGLRTLAGFSDFGQLSAQRVRETLDRVRGKGLTQSEQVQAELALIRSNLDRALARVEADLSRQTGSGTGRLARLANALEPLFDAGDAVRRRKTANRIYRDMARERISSQRAAEELKLLNKRQKGGWLASSLNALFARSGPPAKD